MIGKADLIERLTAIGSGIKGEDTINHMSGAAAGTIAGGGGGEIIKGAASKFGKNTIAYLTGTIGSSYISEKIGGFVTDNLDKKENNEK